MHPRISWTLRLVMPSLLIASSLFLHDEAASAITQSISFHSRSTGANSGTSSLTLRKPTGVSVGDVMIAGIYVSGSVTVSAPSGWTRIRTDGHGHNYFRIADTSVASSFTWKFSGASAAAGVVAAYAGVSTAKPVNVAGGQANASSVSIVAPSVSTTVANSRVVGVFGISRQAGISPPTGMTERAEAASTNSYDNVTVELADLSLSPSGPSGQKTAIASASAINAGQLVVLQPAVYRAFKSTSYWNTPLPANAPIDPNSASFIAYMKATATTNYVALSGGDGTWGRPVYWPKSTDPTYEVVATKYKLPPEFKSLRIPTGARPDPTSDSTVIIFDTNKGYVAGLWAAAYDSSTDTWSAGGGEIYYLASNGLHRSLAQSDDLRNQGHRGLATPMSVIRYDEVIGGGVDHVMRIGIRRPSSKSVFPMVGSDGLGTDPFAPPEGARLRLKRSIRLSTLGLSAAQYALAKAAQDYGFIISDGSDGPISAGLENVVAEGRGRLWSGVLTRYSLQMFPLSDYEFVRLGYGA